MRLPVPMDGSLCHAAERTGGAARPRTHLFSQPVIHAHVRHLARNSAGQVDAPPPPLRTNWTRRVPHPVLIGHAASLTGQVDARRSRLQWPLRNFPTLVLHNITAVFLEEFREGVGWGVPAHCSSGRSPRAAARGP